MLTGSVIFGAVGTAFGIIVAILNILRSVREKTKEDTRSSTLFAIIQQSVSNLEKGQISIQTKIEGIEKTVNNHETRISVLENITEVNR